jgi:hypothetical protein
MLWEAWPDYSGEIPFAEVVLGRSGIAGQQVGASGRSDVTGMSAWRQPIEGLGNAFGPQGPVTVLGDVACGDKRAHEKRKGRGLFLRAYGVG